mmetsp:Transcript_25610/g.70502  ORF Transcript_25610/g.70502 Transcript_25610/m.70502 type:complete len:1784 (-) Transcript_25610:395-5746(-)
MRIEMSRNILSPYAVGICILFIVTVVEAFTPTRLLDARRMPLSAMTAPGNFYFLEFPVNENDSKLNPICADGTPYSFAFRRGTDEHVSKFIIEFEGGPACWDDGSDSSCCSSAGANGRRQVPWLDYMTFFNDQVVFRKTLPELGSCKGVSTGFVAEGAEFILSDSNGISSFAADDVPLVLRREEGWWERLGGNESDIRDWSYILLPHCTMDWHLGHKKYPQLITGCGDDPMKVDGVYHRGGTNVDAVLNWIRKQFPSGLDALVTTAGGQMGGCNDSMGPATTSSIAPALLAAKLKKSETDESSSPPASPSSLVVLEGSGLWDPDLPSPEVMADRWNAIDLPSGGGLPEAVDDLVQSSTKDIQFIWMTSNEGTASEEEELWFMKQANDHRQNFHVFEPTSLDIEGNDTKLEWCSLYTFPDSEVGVADFFADIIQTMSWSSASSSSSTTNLMPKMSLSARADSGAGDDSRGRLTFFTIFMMLGVIVSMTWVIYYIRKHKSSQNGKSAPLSPTDLWFMALTKHPVAFLIVSLMVPIVLSCIGLSQNHLRVNLDFDSYLQVDTDLENVKRNFERAQQNQEASLEIEQANCNLYGNSIFGFGKRKLSDDPDVNGQLDQRILSRDESIFGNQELLHDLGLDVQIDNESPYHALSHHHRELNLANLNYFSGGEWISIMYENRKGGNVFEPEVLKAIHEFESSIYAFPGFQDYCYGLNKCVPIDSLISRFFTNGQLVGDIDAVLRSFLTDRPALWKLDQYFGPDNLASNVTRSFVFLNNVGGDQSATHPFLRSFHRDFLAKHYRRKTYPEFVHTWNNFVMKATEADDALLHDTLWAIGSLCFVALMILAKVQSIFVVFLSMLGMVLAFTVSYYWLSMHFFVKDITLIWVAGLFVMLGIAADDIFLMVDSFDHTKNEFEEIIDNGITDVKSGDSHPDDQEKAHAKIEVLEERMKVAYSKAGSMMLVSSVTTAICFFSNGFGVLTVIQEFGVFMGMVVLTNYIHVMTILPSAILVNELYVASVQERFITWCKSKLLSNRLNHRKNVDEKGEYSKPLPPDTERCLHDGTGDGGEKSKTLNATDRYLVEEYAPFVTKRSYYLLCSTIILAIILGICGAAKFAVNDGSIVLYSSKYNLGRLEKVIDKYYSDGEDVYTTIEENDPSTYAPYPAPTPLPAPTVPTPTPPVPTMTATIEWMNPDEAVAAGLPGAVSSEQLDSTLNTPATASVAEEVSSPEAPQAVGDSDAQSSQIGSSSNQGAGSSIINNHSSSNTGLGSGSKFSSDSSSNTGSYYDASAAGSISKPNGVTNMRRRETIHVKLIWGVHAGSDDSSLWLTKKVRKSTQSENEEFSTSNLDLAEPRTQEWLLKVVEMAKSKSHLFVRQDKLTWIEKLRDFAAYAGVQFPIPKDLFTTYIELLKLKEPTLEDDIEKAIGTSAPGLAGDFTFASLTMMVDAVEVGNAANAAGREMSEDLYRDWTEFAAEANKSSPSDIPPVVAQSGIFLDAYRVEAMYDSTLTTWFVANGLCLLVILLFVQNLALSFMVMVTITLILLCLGGLLFAFYRIPFGPVEALGVSIFIGLSANYSLHVVHAYHHSKSNNREEKIKESIFAVGSPIVASALSTMGASAFLFGCRTWVFIELGILICSITGMALLYTMTFLFSWLYIAGPLPIEKHGENPSHRWDLKVMCWDACRKNEDSPEKADDDGSVFSIEVVEDQQGDSPDEEKPDIGRTEAKGDDDESVYSIEIVEDAQADLEESATDREGRTKEKGDEYADLKEFETESIEGTQDESETENSN